MSIHSNIFRPIRPNLNPQFGAVMVDRNPAKIDPMDSIEVCFALVDAQIQLTTRQTHPDQYLVESVFDDRSSRAGENADRETVVLFTTLGYDAEVV